MQPSMKSRFVVVVVVVIAGGIGCPKDKPAPTPTPDLADKTLIMSGNEAVYDAATPPDPRAAALCEALYSVPAARKAQCCGDATGNSPMVATCTGVLSAAIAGKGLVIDEAKAKACAEAQTQALTGCGWVGLLAPRLPAACAGMFTGLFDEGSYCRSSYECKAGLRCHGNSALDPGRCGPPRPPRALCGGGIDGLAVVTGQVAVDVDHPECTETCGDGRCTARRAIGEACVNDGECGAANRCEQKQCVKGRIAIGEPCVVGGCVDGARCMSGRCQKLRVEGESCAVEFDCARGGCVKQGSAVGVCGMHCGSWRDVETKPKVLPSPRP
jgi:hypothetical protein